MGRREHIKDGGRKEQVALGRSRFNNKQDSDSLEVREKKWATLEVKEGGAGPQKLQSRARRQ